MPNLNAGGSSGSSNVKNKLWVQCVCMCVWLCLYVFVCVSPSAIRSNSNPLHVQKVGGRSQTEKEITDHLNHLDQTVLPELLQPTVWCRQLKVMLTSDVTQCTGSTHLLSSGGRKWRLRSPTSTSYSLTKLESYDKFVVVREKFFHAFTHKFSWLLFRNSYLGQGWVNGDPTPSVRPPLIK